MAQKLGALAALPEDLDLVPQTHTAAHNHPVPEDPVPSPDLHR